MSTSKSSEFVVPFVGLKLGEHEFQYKLNDVFFESLAHFGFVDVNIDAKVRLVKEETFMEWYFETSGTGVCDCDTCGGELKLDLNGSQKLIVKFGDEEQELDGELMVITYDTHYFDLTNQLTDCVMLHAPMRRVHAEGECDEETLEELEKLRYKEDNTSDPRWEGLQKLNNKQNNGTS